MSIALRLLQLNDVRLVGRLTRDPEVRYTPKGQAVARLDLAINRRYKDGTGEWREETSFVPVTVWREAAERCRERLKKGFPVYVEGRLRSTSWETKEGQKRTSLEVEAYRLQFLAKTEESAPGTADEAEAGGLQSSGDRPPDVLAGEPAFAPAPAPVAVSVADETSRPGGSGEDIPF